MYYTLSGRMKHSWDFTATYTCLAMSGHTCTREKLILRSCTWGMSFKLRDPNWIAVSDIDWGSVIAHSVLFWALILELLMHVLSSESSVSPIFSLFSVSSIEGETVSAGKRCSRCSGQGLQQCPSSVGEIFSYCNFSRTGADGSSCTAYHNW